MTARTNLEGEYELKDVKPGRYYLRVNRNGYVMQAHGQKTPNPNPRTGALLTVREGEILRQVDVKLIRGGVVEGRVVDLDGEPMARAQIMLERFVTQQGKRTLRPMGFGTTDDRGRFRIFGIAPGRYYISARYQNWKEEGADSAYPPIYYPGTANPQEAARIDVVGGGQVSGIDIPLTETKAVSISGKVVRNDGKPAVQAMLMAMRIEETGFMGFTGGGEWLMRKATSKSAVCCRAATD
ncbi:MAG: carboxypeptidase regulatory-like domain-containing protein [Acidobacteria bacterium]|nr:carboxypeptidase regulatory-like domain-containing protein [Acidobacteriota bacterium]